MQSGPQADLNFRILSEKILIFIFEKDLLCICWVRNNTLSKDFELQE